MDDARRASRREKAEGAESRRDRRSSKLRTCEEGLQPGNGALVDLSEEVQGEMVTALRHPSQPGMRAAKGLDGAVESAKPSIGQREGGEHPHGEAPR